MVSRPLGLSAVVVLLAACGDASLPSLTEPLMSEAPVLPAAETKAPVCHQAGGGKWQLLELPAVALDMHLAKHELDEKPLNRVPGMDGHVFDLSCVPQVAFCPIWDQDLIGGFAGWETLSDYLSGGETRITILDGNVGGYGNAWVSGNQFAFLQIEPDGGPAVFEFMEDFTPLEGAACRAVLYDVAEAQAVACTGELCPA